MVNLPSSSHPTGRLNVAYLPLQGRQAAGDIFTASIPNVELGFGSDVFIEPLATTIQFILNGNQVQQRGTSVPIPDGLSRPFNTFFLNITKFTDDTGGGGTVFTAGSDVAPFVDGMPFAASLRIFPDRETTLPIFLNDAMIDVQRDETGAPFAATFEPDVFNQRNGIPLQGFISDFLMFDVSNLGANRPTMSTGAPANRVYFSGDRFALSDLGPSGYFEMLTDNLSNPDHGQFQDPVTIGNSLSPGIYRTVVPDPTDPSHTNTITEIYGIFRNFIDPTMPSKSMVVNTGNFEVLLMPKTEDGEDLQMILVSLNGSKATNLYWGDAHLTTGSFVAYPIADITNGSTAGSIQGTLSGFLDASGSPLTVNSVAVAKQVRYGRYNITTLLPAGFSRSGRLIVFRK